MHAICTQLDTFARVEREKAAFGESSSGTREPVRLADAVLIDRGITEVAWERIGGASIVFRRLGGTAVYRAALVRTKSPVARGAAHS